MSSPRPPSLLAVLPVVLAALLPAQKQGAATADVRSNSKWRLEHRLESPLLYLSRLGPALVDPLPLLNDPVLQRLLAPRAPGGLAGRSGALLRPLARLLSRKSEDLELALTKMVRAVEPGTETPSLIFRCQLVDESAGQVAQVLQGTLAEPSRKLHGQQVYRLKATAKGSGGSPVEVVLVDGNLVVSNDPVALGQAINPRTVSSTAGAPVLSHNDGYTSLREHIDVPKGAVMFYANWGRLGPRLSPSALVEMKFGLPFRWSGLADTDRLLLVARPAKRGSDGFVTSVLLGRRPPRPRPHWPAHWPRGHDGWLRAVQPARPMQLVSGLHCGGLGSLAVALDPKKLLGPAGRGPRMRRLQAWIFGRAFQMGLDVTGQIIGRLGKIGGAQVLLLPGDGVRPRVAYSFEAKSSSRARELVTDLQKALANSGRARTRQLKSGKEVLEIKSPGFERRFGGRDHALLAAIGDTVYFTFDQETMEHVVRQVAQMSGSKGRQVCLQQEAMVRQYLKHLGAWDQKVAGIFATDLGAIARRVVGNDEDQGKSKTGSGLFGMHAGYFTVEQDLVRLEVFSPR